MRFATPGRIRAPDPPQPPLPSPAPKRTLVLRPKLALILGAAAMLALAVLWFLPKPPAAPDPEAFNKAVEAYLRKRAPDPSPANVAFAVIQPSLIVVQGKAKDAAEDDPFALGTGIIVDENGTILTCLHVVAGSETIVVTFPDGFQTEAALVNAQADNDLAVLMPAIVPENLTPAVLGGTADLRIGDPVVAVGNPFGLVASVSEGVISGLNRSTNAESGPPLKGLIQFDAAVNPGNSGGPLLNRRGEVVGLVTALINPTKQSFFVGIGYAITIETAGRAFDIPPW